MILSNQEKMYAAFFVHGADCVPSQEHLNGLVEAATKCDVGFWEFVQQMIAYADKLQAIVNVAISCRDNETSFPGVFEYEVCEAFGHWYVETTLRNWEELADKRYSPECSPGEAECLDFLRKAVFYFFRQDGDGDAEAEEKMRIALNIKE